MKARWQGGPQLKQVDDEASNSARICKMITMPPFKSTKIIHEEDQHGGSCYKLKTLFCKIKVKWVAWQPQEKGTQHDKESKEWKVRSSLETCCWSFQQCEEFYLMRSQIALANNL
jgi:hypothetical protein